MVSGITQHFNNYLADLAAGFQAFLDGNVELIEDLVVQVPTASKIHDQPTPVLLPRVEFLRS